MKRVLFEIAKDNHRIHKESVKAKEEENYQRLYASHKRYRIVDEVISWVLALNIVAAISWVIYRIISGMFDD